MPLIDDLEAPIEAKELTRRKALSLITGAAFTAAGIGAAITTVRFMRPNVLFEPPTKIPIGRPETIAMGKMLVLPEQKLYVAHTPAGFFAMSAECTHLGCMTRFEEQQKRIVCPCHGSQFDLTGRVTAGPAPQPLPRKHISLQDGQLVVDIRKPAEADFVLKA